MEKMKKSIMTENIHFQTTKKPITSHTNHRSIFHRASPSRLNSPDIHQPPPHKNKSFKDIEQKKGRNERESRKEWYAGRPETSKGNRISSICKKSALEDCELCWKQLDQFSIKNNNEPKSYGTDVVIILNKNLLERKQRQNYEDKFETHLSSDFLNLFAD